MEKDRIKVMSIMAHQDDFEFRAGGTFAQLRKKYGDRIEIKLVNTSKGATGHHIMGLDETFNTRMKEFRNSAAIIGAECECLTQLDGSHVQAQVFIDRNFLGGLWNTIRSFEPDFLFCPPITNDSIDGIHIDHFNTATGVRMVAYQLCVPHAYPTVGGAVKKKIKMPLIINVDDVYYGRASSYHVANDITDVFDVKMKMAFCHRSQIMEWLPFSQGHNPPTEEESRENFINMHRDINAAYGKSVEMFREYFSFTYWGRKPVKEDIERVFSRIDRDEKFDAFLKTFDALPKKGKFERK